jgi:hypothetical protein
MKKSRGDAPQFEQRTSTNCTSPNPSIQRCGVFFIDIASLSILPRLALFCFVDIALLGAVLPPV